MPSVLAVTRVRVQVEPGDVARHFGLLHGRAQLLDPRLALLARFPATPGRAVRGCGAPRLCACESAVRCACSDASAWRSASSKRARSISNSTSPAATCWLSWTWTRVSWPVTSGATWTTLALTRPSRVHGSTS